MSNLNEFTNSGAMVHLNTTWCGNIGLGHAAPYVEADQTVVLNALCRILRIYWISGTGGGINHSLDGSSLVEITTESGRYVYFSKPGNESDRCTVDLKVNGGETFRWSLCNGDGTNDNTNSRTCMIEQWGY